MHPSIREKKSFIAIACALVSTVKIEPGHYPKSTGGGNCESVCSVYKVDVICK